MLWLSVVALMWLLHKRENSPAIIIVLWSVVLTEPMLVSAFILHLP